MNRLPAILFALLATVASASDVVAPSENLVVEGVPEAPAALADALQPYTEFRSASFESWHPVRREMLISTQFANTAQIHLVKRPGDARTQLTFCRDMVREASFRPVSGDCFVFAGDRDGSEFFQKYRYDLGTKKIALLTDGESRNTFGIWSASGQYYAYGSTRRTGKDVDLWMMDPRDPASDRMVAELEGGGWQPLDFSPDGRQLLALNRLSANESYPWLIDVATGEKTQLASGPSNEKVAYWAGKFSRDGKRVYVLTDRDSDFQRLAFINLADNSHGYLTSDLSWDVSQFSLSWDGKTIAFVVNVEGQGALHLLDTATGRELAKPDLPAGAIDGLRWHRNNRDLGFSLLDSRRGADAYSLDMASGEVQRWTYSETGGIDADALPLPEVVHWESFDGLSISAWLYRPPARFAGKRPVIIQIHGGPESQAKPTLSPLNTYLVNELGVAVMLPNVRGSMGYGKKFLALDNGFNREDSYKDIGSLLDWIAQCEGLDPERVMVTGGSYGGFMTLAVAANYADRIRCALDIVGPSNLTTFLENTADYRRDLRREEYGDERDPTMREFQTRIAPMTRAGKIVKPLFVVQGGNDPRVPLSESEQIVRIVRENGTPVWYLMARDEGHGFAKRGNKDFLMYSTVLFVQKFLLD